MRRRTFAEELWFMGWCQGWAKGWIRGWIKGYTGRDDQILDLEGRGHLLDSASSAFGPPPASVRAAWLEASDREPLQAWLATMVRAREEAAERQLDDDLVAVGATDDAFWEVPGQIQGLRLAVLRAFRARFGDAPAQAGSLLLAINEVRSLAELHQDVITAGTRAAAWEVLRREARHGQQRP